MMTAPDLVRDDAPDLVRDDAPDLVHVAVILSAMRMCNDVVTRELCVTRGPSEHTTVSVTQGRTRSRPQMNNLQ